MTYLSEAIILAGGKGTRISSITENKYPKGLVEVKGKPILQWQLDWLKGLGIKKVIFALGHHNELISKRFGDQYSDNVEIIYSVEKKKLGSGGAIRLARKYVASEHILILNGDVLTTSPLKKLSELHLAGKYSATMLLTKLLSPYGVVEMERTKIKKFVEKPLLDIPIHSGVDIVKRTVLDDFPISGQMEDTIFPKLANENEFGALMMENEHFWRSIDSPKDLSFANENWPGF